MLKNKIWLGIILSIILLVFSINGFTAYYKYTQESGANFYVGIADKADALEDTNEMRQIIDDLGALLVHSKRNDLYPKDATTGGTIQIPEAGLKFGNVPVNDDIAAYIAGEMMWQTKVELGLDLSLYYLKTEMDSSSELAGIISDETGTNKLVFSDNPVLLAPSISQIVFPATQVPSAGANTLDDYEEGTWTPVLEFGGNSVDMTYTIQTGYYTKIGNQVTLIGEILLSAKGTSTGIVSITGLPFTCKTGLYGMCSLRLQQVTFANVFTGALSVSTIYIEETTEAGVVANLDNTNFVDNSKIHLSVTYLTN